MLQGMICFVLELLDLNIRQLVIKVGLYIRQLVIKVGLYTSCRTLLYPTSSLTPLLTLTVRHTFGGDVHILDLTLIFFLA